MKKTYLKNILIISLLMVMVQLIGLLFQLITKSSTVALSLKLLFMVFFVVIVLSIRYKPNVTAYLSGIISISIGIISCVYMDYLTVLIALILLFYSYKLYNEQHTKSITIDTRELK